MIDFKEIPSGNRGGEFQDRFEEFASHFLEFMGYQIIEGPSRGADGGKDMVVAENIGGLDGNQVIKWLVSCKHYAYSGKSVSIEHENNILERLTQHGCDGFLPFYSTSISNGLSNRLKGLQT